MLRIESTHQDITTLDVDVIVNAANERLTPGAGVCGAIHEAAGPRLAEICEVLAGALPGGKLSTGKAIITPGFDLPAKFVIHAVGPVWIDGTNDEEPLLSSAYAESLQVARSCRSIAFPAISCGIFGFPIDRACAVAWAVFWEHASSREGPRNIILSCFDQRVYDQYEKYLGDDEDDD